MYETFQIAISCLGLFFLLVIAVLLIIVLLKNRPKQGNQSNIEIVDMSEEYEDIAHTMHSEMMSKAEWKKHAKAKKAEEKEKSESTDLKTVFVMDFDGDTKGTEADNLGSMITSILLVAKPNDSVVLRLESPGGMVHTYGLASSHLARLRDAKIDLTICVDKVAASGGYMMACLANTLIAAPFAILGSIGVVASIPNFNKLLRRNDVDYLELTAGEYKRTVSVFGEITEKGKEKFVEQLEDTHLLFKEHVQQYRSAMDLSKVTTGEYWYGKRALELGLVDELMTSSQYLMSLLSSSKIYHVSISEHETFADKLKGFVSSSVQGYFDTLLEQRNKKTWFTS